MQFTEKIVYGTLVKRYKRFFSDVRLDSGEIVVAHTPNTGPMTTCWEAGMRCLLTESNNPERKLKYTLKLTFNGQVWINVNTHSANKVVHEILQKKQILSLAHLTEIKPEFKVGKSRFDFHLSSGSEECFLEVKNVSTVKDGIAIFPDTISERALKHIEELTELVESGKEAVLCFLVCREDCSAVRPAGEIQPEYLLACQKAAQAGVKIMGVQCLVSPEGISFKQLVPVILD